MVSVAEAARGIYGAWRLAHGDRGGLAYFDSSLDGFWRSFGAAIVALPAYIGLVALSIADYDGEVNFPGVALVESISYAIDWFAFPLVAYYLCRAFGWSDRYLLFIVALNWAKVVIATLMLPAAIVASIAPGGIFAVVPFAALGAVAAYVWFVTRAALACGGGEAAMMTLVNFVLGVGVALWSRSLLM